MRKAAAIAGWYWVVRLTERWGALPNEIDAPMPGDELIPSPALNATRGIELHAPPDQVFPWLVQMGPGRAGWYSYDWIDNGGTRSAEDIRQEWQAVEQGGSLGSVAGIEFLVAERRDPDAFVIRLPQSSPIAFTIAYRLRPWAGGTRLVVRVRASGPPLTGPFLRFLLGPGDFLMLQRQLRGLSKRTSNGSSPLARVVTESKE